MTEDERYQWSESLRTRDVLVAGGTGLIYGIATLLIFGPIASGSGGDAKVVHMLPAFFGSAMLSMFVFHSILVRQLALPAAVIGGIYSLINYRGLDLYRGLYVCGLAVVVLVAMALIEARTTTGRLSDFWRSFLFHPLGWSKHFHIQTRVD